MMAIWWSTGPVPLGITSLLPMLVLPMAGIGDTAKATTPYASPLVFLFLGGFLMGAAIQRWGLHQRLAHAVVKTAGTGPKTLVLGFMAATAFLSMWISNTAAVILMLPVAVSVIGAMGLDDDTDQPVMMFAPCLLLGLAYSANIGGVGTLIGSPPNALLAGFMRQHGTDISFAAWSAVAMPFAGIFVMIAWLVLTTLVFRIPFRNPGAITGTALIARLKPDRPVSCAERRVALVFATAVALWITRPLLNTFDVLAGLTDPAIAIGCAVVLFLVPSGGESGGRRLMTWRDAQGVPWEILILLGGGLSLATAVDESGLAAWLASNLSPAAAISEMFFLLAVAGMVVSITELASNTATVAAFLPVMTAVAEDAGHSVISVSTAIAMAASCAFMLPAATPPNAIVLSTGHLTVLQMVRAGLLLNVISVLLIVIAAPLVPALIDGAH